MSEFSGWLVKKYSKNYSKLYGLSASELGYYAFWGWFILIGVLVAALVFSVGCVSGKCPPPRVIETTRVVTVPVPAPPVYSLPDLPIFSLPVDASDAVFVRAVVESVLVLMRDNQNLAQLLESYRVYAAEPPK